MSTHNVIVCESSGRWAASLRATVALTDCSRIATPATHETRSLRELKARLAEGRHAVALVEVRQQNLLEVLTLVSEGRLSYPQVHFVALLAIGDELEVDNISLVHDALRAAGMIDVVDSPRGLSPILSIVERIAEAPHETLNLDDSSLLEWAQRLLPWQDATRPIG